MKSITNEIGFKEITIVDDCDFELFYLCAENLGKLLGIAYTNQVHDFDSIYWEFDFMGAMFILHYNIYLGISIYSQKGKDSSPADNKILDEIYELIKDSSIVS
ncbi:DUF3630 family protein [Mucilaginibacter sp. BT774]|uniref:DUF3630 family protein n=1 Tax=Mucilaginibacter sp. BT774 TaxID=3062276 RepID=UPI0026766840|nr:DUF3630 family protein [Mucilaginibacter sp. BT774]MDO3626123.1 DUF3630 family protein [Mucilaginibacter sp. BT774]